MIHVSELEDLIKVSKLDTNSFQGYNKPIGSPHIFGGQVLAQSLYAMNESVPEGRFCHSLHSYFILPGNLEKPIFFEVENIRDGGSFSVRKAIAKQNDRPIFYVTASFQGKENGFEHQLEMPNVKHHSELMSWDEMYDQFKDLLPKSIVKFLSVERPIEFKPAVIPNPSKPEKMPPFQNVWFKIKGESGNEAKLNQSILAYITDYNILSTALHPNADQAKLENMQMATLDHSIWFFREFDVNQWMLFAIDTPSASNARGFTRGNIFTESGKLIASVTQEGLMRPITK